jgi:predicted Zn-dependent peptidase
MNSILGGGMSSRLFQSLREELGLAYSVYAAMASYSDTGSLSFHIGTGTGKIAQFFAELVKVLEHFAAGGVTAVELERNRQMSRAGLYMGLESVLTRMNRMGRTLMMYGEYQSPEYVMAQVDAVRREDINALAQEMLELKTMSLAAIGPEGILPAVQEEFDRWFR